MMQWIARIALAVALAAAPAAGLVIVSGDGTGNTAAPSPDPGWERFGTKSPCPPQCGLTFVYLGEGWVLTARHVTATDVLFLGSGQVAKVVAGSQVEFGGGASPADLLLFRIHDGPDLPLLPITRESPREGRPVLLIGYGYERRQALPGNPSPGYASGPPPVLRWGTNRVTAERIRLPDQVAGTAYFLMRFDAPGSPLATPHEAQAVLGDSGGAVFVREPGGWELAGILFVATEPLFGGGYTVAVDLAQYRADILRAVGGFGKKR